VDACDPDAFDRYGGWTGIESEATGRFRVEEIDGRWWFITPEGHAFFSAGVQNVNPDPDRTPDGRRPYNEAILAKYGSEEAWAEAALDLIRRVGINTIGDFSRLRLFTGRMPYTPGLGLAGNAPVVDGAVGGGIPLRDFFAPGFATGAAANADRAHACAADPYCIGVYSDDEIGWGPSFAQPYPILDGYMKLPAGAPGKQAIQAFMEDRYGGDLAAFNAAWGLALGDFAEIQQLVELSANPAADPPARQADRRAFAGAVADHYYQVVHDLLRAIDPELLFLGSRFLPNSVPPEVVEAAGRWVDVVSFNLFEWTAGAIAASRLTFGYAGGIFPDQPFADVDTMAALAGKPLLLSSFSYRAADSGLPNSWPPVYPTLANQTQRADAYEAYMRRALARPFIVGAHWFEYVDQPREGRSFDAENNNFGVVDIADEPYRELLTRMWWLAWEFYDWPPASPQPLDDPVPQ
jgi:agarase